MTIGTTRLRDRLRRRPDWRTAAALVCGTAMIAGAVAIIPSPHNGPRLTTVAATGALSSPQCDNDYQPATGYHLDVCIATDGTTVTPSVNVTAIGATGSSCSIVLEIWDDANNRLDNSAAAGYLPCQTGQATGTRLDLNTLQNVTAHTSPDGSLTVHAFARLYIDGKGIYIAGQGNSPTVTVSPNSGSANSSSSGAAVPAHTSPASMTGPAGQKDIPTMKATSVDSVFNNVTATINQDGAIVCYEGVLPIPCFETPEAFALAVNEAATDAGIDPRLLLAIMINDRGIHNQAIPHFAAGEFVRWLFTLIGKDHSLGLTNMSSSAFHDAQQAAGPNSDLAKHSWTDVIANPVLAIDAAAWLLRGVEEQLPPTWPAQYKRDELLAIGYNGGGSVMTGVASGLTPDQADPRNPGKVSWYVGQIDANWDSADSLFCQSGSFTCAS